MRKGFKTDRACQKIFKICENMTIISIERQKSKDGQRMGIAFVVTFKKNGRTGYNTIWLVEDKGKWFFTDMQIIVDDQIFYKDIIEPLIDIEAPEAKAIYGSDPPKFNITIIEANLNCTWYTINNNSTKHFFEELNGTLKEVWESFKEYI